MEWDIGTSWYRPTRILHVTSGSEFGWRGGCYKWPESFPDSLPAVVNVGPGSPTGITFGTKAAFPDKYQRALFACDWSRGSMHVIHLTPRGSSYVGETESFVSANALPFTDVTVQPTDGALYFTTGGRGVQSGLYKVTYNGTRDNDKTEPPRDERAVAARKQMESLHVRNGAISNLELVWDHLDHADRHVAFAARTALEHVDAEHWAERALQETVPAKRLAALLALVRTRDDVAPAFWPAIGEVNCDRLDRRGKLLLLRTIELALVRHPDSIAGGAPYVLQLDRQFPNQDSELNKQLGKLLTHVNAPQVVARTLDVVDRESSPIGKLHYLLALQNSTADWSLTELQRYLTACADCKAGSGGKSYGGYVDDLVELLEQRLNDEQRRILSTELAAAKRQPTAFRTEVNRPFVKKWELAELQQALASGKLVVRQGNPKHGQQLFEDVHCSRCHRVNEVGGSVGPDLTSIAKRFNTADMLATIVEPDQEISDQYRSAIFELESGKVVTGRVANRTKNDLFVLTDMYNPGLLTVIPRDEIATMRESSTSPMPAGLLDTLTLEEIQDLLAYLTQGVTKVHPLIQIPNRDSSAAGR